VWVLPTDEERVIARQTAALLGRAPPNESAAASMAVAGPMTQG